ncbi:hypothetical protein CDG81_13730 [Actinopolyspora erythraea]|uniref:Uncharacterized protein n=1 Tax=Actinopolyspora erythraea TaxID=414996 RepID=A0A099D4B5_9ACTN|nr:hypothetical protein [Actinopolyspora erythraea]ASU79172.1 hypothetical protein CDG81_13730 [Actinopolyspora erythraea]KGI80647.1 hypothetical protein IL38_16085 [Actinopolyspora erythraea]
MAAVPPSTSELIYAVHQDGFAGHMLRTPEVGRFHLQCAPTATTRDWPQERIEAELCYRLAIGDALALGDALRSRLHDGDTTGLDIYSDRRLRVVWQAQQFADWLLHLINLSAEDSAFTHQLARSRLAELRRKQERASGPMVRRELCGN